MDGNEYIAQILQEEGVTDLCCFPNNPLIEAAAKLGIRPVMFRHERGALMAADAYSRVSHGDRFGIAVTQNAAGAENAMGGLSQAFADNIPMLMLPGGYPLADRQVRPNFSAVQNYRGLVKSVESVDSPRRVADQMRRAFQGLRNGRGGPMVLELTADVCTTEVPQAAQRYTSPKRMRQLPAPTDIATAARTLLAAKRPMIWAGQGVLMSGASEAMQALAEQIDIPVFTTMEGKSAFDERHPLALGAGSNTSTGEANAWIQESDVVLALGSSLSLNSYTLRVPSGKTVIHNTNAPDDINKETACDIALVGDARLTIEALIHELKSQAGAAPLDKGTKAAVAAARQAWLADWKDLLESDEEPLNTYRVIHEIDINVDSENSTVTHDAGAPRDSMVPFFTATNPHSYVGWGKTTHLGMGIPLMIGAKLANPDRFCLNMMGDGAFGMSGMDLETSVREQLPITTVILDNGGMATYPGGFPNARERFNFSSMTGDYARIAEGMGATGLRVSKVDELGPAILEARELNAAGKTVLIDVQTNFEARKSRF
ncbi:MAG: acetolactate synthase-1/2/3 large subunit/hypothetical protein [Chloroflexi bacterium]|nr:MAG: acetolactate synthase-1/2/3 large subunit/hypothetical protein [Chloroflexota bacterium]